MTVQIIPPGTNSPPAKVSKDWTIRLKISQASSEGYALLERRDMEG